MPENPMMNPPQKPKPGDAAAAIADEPRSFGHERDHIEPSFAERITALAKAIPRRVDETKETYQKPWG